MVATTTDRRSARKEGAGARLHVQRTLAGLGLPTGRPQRSAPGSGDPRRLREALARLGPAFAAFGRFLSSRPDLLADAVRGDLAGVVDREAGTGADPFVARAERTLGRPFGEVLPVFDERPFRASPLRQAHRARLADGREVVVERLRPGVEERLAADAGLLDLLVPALAGLGADPEAVERSLGEFAAWARAETDLVRQAAALEGLRADAADHAGLRVPAVLGEISSDALLVREALPGPTVAEVLAGGAAGGAAAGSADEAAVLLCLVWLRQALRGRLFPVQPEPDETVLMAGGAVAWTGGACASLPSAAQAHLVEYLAAVAERDPERAVDALLEELPGSAADDAAELRARFRRAVPFRDGGPGARDDLGGFLCLYLRLVAEQGVAVPAHLLELHRGLARVLEPVRALTAAGPLDPLERALGRLRLSIGLGELGTLLDAGRWGRVAEEAAVALLAVPEQVEGVLERAARGQLRLKVELPSEPARGRSDAPVILLLAFGAALALWDRVGAAGYPAWAFHGAALLAAAFGVALLRSLIRSGRRGGRE